MKVGRLLGTIVSILLILSFIRVVNGAPFIGVSEVLARFDDFEFDLEPFNNLVKLWKDSYKQSLADAPAPDGFFELIISALESVYKKLHFIGEIISYFWDNGVSLLSVPIQMFIQLWDFVLWLLGFTV